MVAKSPRGARQKGARGEREVVEILTEMGFEAEKLSRSGYTGPDILVNGHLAEVKFQDSMSGVDWKWLDQTSEAEFLFKRPAGKEWLVVMDIETFAKIYPH